jgi:hypothetical protein
MAEGGDGKIINKFFQFFTQHHHKSRPTACKSQNVPQVEKQIVERYYDKNQVKRIERKN